MTQLVWVAGLDFSPEVPFSGTVRRGKISARLLHQTGTFPCWARCKLRFPTSMAGLWYQSLHPMWGNMSAMGKIPGAILLLSQGCSTSPPKTQFSFGDWGNSVGIREQVPTLLLVWVMLNLLTVEDTQGYFNSAGNLVWTGGHNKPNQVLNIFTLAF